MLNRYFFLLLIIIFTTFISTKYITYAYAAMQGENNFLEIEPIDENEAIESLSSEQKPEAEKLVKIVFTTPENNTKGFRLTISNILIDYGVLSPTNPIIRENNLMISNSISGVFSILGRENHPLNAKSGTIIPDTSCDNGACTMTLASIWENSLTYGFGYRCENILSKNCASDFQNENYFKQFPSVSDKEEFIHIINGVKSDTQSESKIIYKVNTATSQPQESYSNKINYILVPGY